MQIPVDASPECPPGCYRPKHSTCLDGMTLKSEHEQRAYPACITCKQVAEILGINRRYIPKLIRAKLLKPLAGWITRTGPKHFAFVEIKENAADIEWLARASRAIHRED